MPNPSASWLIAILPLRSIYDSTKDSACGVTFIALAIIVTLPYLFTHSLCKRYDIAPELQCWTGRLKWMVPWRGHLAKFGIVTRQGVAGVSMLVGLVEDIRRLLVVGAHAVLRFRRKRKAAPTVWATELLAKKPYTVVAVALANKMARVVWALMTTGKRFEARAA